MNPKIFVLCCIIIYPFVSTKTENSNFENIFQSLLANNNLKDKALLSLSGVRFASLRAISGPVDSGIPASKSSDDFLNSQEVQFISAYPTIGGQLEKYKNTQSTSETFGNKLNNRINVEAILRPQSQNISYKIIRPGTSGLRSSGGIRFVPAPNTIF